MDNKLRIGSSTSANYTLAVIVICTCYALFQLAIIPFLSLGVDELWFAHHIYRYTEHLPFRDFQPYKSVLGYYLLSLPLHFSHGLLAPLDYIKDEVAIINTCLLALVSLWAKRWFQPRAIFYSVVLILSNMYFLMYSADLRVDMLASWLCLVSVLFLLDKRPALAGVFLALGFLTSQKAIWYIGASDGALLITALSFAGDREGLKTFLSFNLALIAIITGYILFWACFSNLHTVLHATFYEAYTQSKLTFYAPNYAGYWQVILRRGPILLLLWPLSFLMLFDRSISQTIRTRRIFILSYASLTMLGIALYTQFFPYNIVLLLAAFFVLYTEFLSWLLSPKQSSLNERQLFWFFSIYITAVSCFVLVLCLSLLYLLIVFIPIVLWYLLTKLSRDADFSSDKMKVMIISCILLSGVVTPLMGFANFIYLFNNDYQKEMIQLTDALVKDGSDYIAGTFLLYDRDQTVAGFKNLIAPALKYSFSADPKFLPALLPSLDITAKYKSEMLEELEKQPVKLVINNTRITDLPVEVIHYFKMNYEHYWGGIYLYAPAISADQKVFNIKFNGKYTVESEAHANIIIDGKSFSARALIYLAKGPHQSIAATPYRLKLLPENISDNMLDPRFRHDCPVCLVKPIWC